MSQKNCGLTAALCRARVSVVAGFTTLLFAASTYGATWIWTGGGLGNGKWSNSANWGSVGIPGNGDTVIFQGASGLNSTNDIAGLTLGQIKFISGGFNIYGLPFTLTNSLVATNFTGGIMFSNSFTIATADVTMLASNGITVTLNGSIGGSVGVIKTGAGTLLYQCIGNNTYSGTTLVSAGTLQLNVSGPDAVSGLLVIGDGTGAGAPTVRDLQGQEIPDSDQVTVNLNGLLDLNNYNEIIGSLTMQGSTVNSENAVLILNGNLTILGSSVVPVISGNLTFDSKATIFLQSAPYFPNSFIYANINDNGFGLVVTNLFANDISNPSFNGSNTITGPLSIYNTWLEDGSGNALGATNPVTLTSGQIILRASSYTNKTLTIQGNNSYLDSIGNCTWAGPIVLVGNQTIYSYDDGPLNLAGPITGTGNLTVETFDTNFVMVLSGSAANTFTGDLWMQVGTLEFAKTASEGAIPHNLTLGWNNGGTLYSATNLYLANNQISNGGTVTLTCGSVMNLNNYVDGVGSLVLNAGTSVKTGTGKLDMYSPGTITTPLPAGAAPTISGTLGEAVNCTFSVTNDLNIPANIYSYASYNFTKTGSGNLYLSGANTYTGPTMVQQGWLWADSALALGGTNGGTYVSSGATLGMGGSIIITNEPLTLNGPGVSTGWGSLDVRSGTNTWQGPITNNANCTLDSWNSGSQLHISGPISGPGSLELFNDGPGGGTIFFEGSTANTYAGLTTVDTNSTLLLNKSASDSAVLNGLLINGTVRDEAAGQINNAAAVVIGPSGLLDFSLGGDGIGSLDGSGSVNLGANFVDSFGAGSHTYNGIIFGSGLFDIAAAITYTLNGNNTYTGETHLYDGDASTIFINGSQPQSPVYVGATDTLGGTGVVGVITGKGTIAPGNGSPGILSCSNVTFSSSGTFLVQLTGPIPGTGYDQLNVRGTNTLANATLTVLPAFTTPVAVGQQFVILNNDSIDPITGTFNGLPEGSTFTVGNYKFAISYVGGTGNDVVLTLKSIPGAAVSSSVTAGDGSHAIDPNGCNNFSLVISNTTGSAMTGVNATLSTTTEGVLITQPYAPYSNIPADGTGTNLMPFQISALPGFICGTPINLQLSVLSSLGAFTMNYVLQTGETAAVPSRYDVTGNVAIPDVGTVDSTNAVSGFIATPLNKVAVSLYITHPFDSDLTNISLISPDGTTVLLSSANGVGGQNYGSGLTPDSNRTTFDDAGGTSITNGAAPFVGTYRPQSPLSAFIYNPTPNGNWHLHIADGFGGSSGTLRAWSLFLYGATCNTGSGACDYCLTSVTGSITNTDLLQVGRITRTGSPSSCGAPKASPGLFDSLLRHYDIYGFTNTAADEACVTVLLTANGDVQAGVYLNSFNPTNILLNYLADSGDSTDDNSLSPQSCSASIPPGATFYVTVDEVTPGAGCTNYTVQLSGLPCPPPTLNIQPVSPGKARLYWDTSAGGYVLQSVSNLTANVWGAVTNEPIVTGNSYNVTNSTAGPATNQFYRLQQP